MVKHVRIYVDFHKIWGIQFHGIYIPISDASVKISIGFQLLSKVSICHKYTQIIGILITGKLFLDLDVPNNRGPSVLPTFLYERILCSCSNIEICPSSIRSQYQVGTPLLIQQQRLIRIPQWYYHTTLYIFYIPHSQDCLQQE